MYILFALRIEEKTYKDVNDFKFLKASTAIFWMMLLLKSLHNLNKKTNNNLQYERKYKNLECTQLFLFLLTAVEEVCTV